MTPDRTPPYRRLSSCGDAYSPRDAVSPPSELCFQDFPSKQGGAWHERLNMKPSLAKQTRHQRDPSDSQHRCSQYVICSLPRAATVKPLGPLHAPSSETTTPPTQPNRVLLSVTSCQISVTVTNTGDAGQTDQHCLVPSLHPPLERGTKEGTPCTS